MQNNVSSKERKVLFRIRDLKQYFPVNGNKKLFVKANDGISLDIYQGETFGLVGESGCGKSTMGRVLLQLYHQTHGRTVYYGRSLDSVAPDYMRDTAAQLSKMIKGLGVLEQERVKREAEYKKESSTGTDGAFEALERFNEAKKLYEDAYYNIVQIIGGLIVADDIDEVSQAYLARYNAALAVKKVKEECSRLQMDIDDTAFAMNKSRGEERLTLKHKVLLEKRELLEKKLEKLNIELKKTHSRIKKLRDKYHSKPDFEMHEKVRDDGIDLARLKYSEMRVLRRDMQLIFQDPYSSLNPRMSVGQIIGEGLRTHNFFKKNGERQQNYTIEIMEKCGLAAYFLHRYPHQFSGGQRQRIGIARSLAVKPTFVVCDEAVSALDVSIQSQIINLLQDLREEEHLTYLFISHDLSVVKYISDRIGVMYLGSLVELAQSADLFKNPLHPYTAALLAAIPTTETDKERQPVILEGDIPSPINPPKGCKFHTRCLYCTDICKKVTPEFEEISPGHFVACHHRNGL